MATSKEKHPLRSRNPRLWPELVIFGPQKTVKVPITDGKLCCSFCIKEDADRPEYFYWIVTQIKEDSNAALKMKNAVGCWVVSINGEETTNKNDRFLSKLSKSIGKLADGIVTLLLRKPVKGQEFELWSQETQTIELIHSGRMLPFRLNIFYPDLHDSSKTCALVDETIPLSQTGTDLKGLKRGDKVTAINGHKLVDITFPLLLQITDQLQPGIIRLEIQRRLWRQKGYLSSAALQTPDTMRWNPQKQQVKLKRIKQQPLGLTIVSNKTCIMISRILAGQTPAAMCPYLSPGCKITSINGHTLHGTSLSVANTLFHSAQGRVRLTIQEPTIQLNAGKELSTKQHTWPVQETNSSEIVSSENDGQLYDGKLAMIRGNNIASGYCEQTDASDLSAKQDSGSSEEVGFSSSKKDGNTSTMEGIVPEHPHQVMETPPIPDPHPSTIIHVEVHRPLSGGTVSDNHGDKQKSTCFPVEKLQQLSTKHVFQVAPIPLSSPAAPISYDETSSSLKGCDVSSECAADVNKADQSRDVNTKSSWTGKVPSDFPGNGTLQEICYVAMKELQEVGSAESSVRHVFEAPPILPERPPAPIDYDETSSSLIDGTTDINSDDAQESTRVPVVDLAEQGSVMDNTAVLMDCEKTSSSPQPDYATRGENSCGDELNGVKNERAYKDTSSTKRNMPACHYPSPESVTCKLPNHAEHGDKCESLPSSRIALGASCLVAGQSQELPDKAITFNTKECSCSGKINKEQRRTLDLDYNGINHNREHPPVVPVVKPNDIEKKQEMPVCESCFSSIGINRRDQVIDCIPGKIYYNICTRLNVINEPFTDDFRMLGEELGFQRTEVDSVRNQSNPTDLLLRRWKAKEGRGSNVGVLIKAISELQREDLLELLQGWVDNCLECFEGLTKKNIKESRV